MSTIIKPSSELRKNYNSIADNCRKTKSPVFLTKNGTGDTVIMDIETLIKYLWMTYKIVGKMKTRAT